MILRQFILEEIMGTGPIISVNEIQRDLNVRCNYNIITNASDPHLSGIHFRVEQPEINFIGRTEELYDLEQFFSFTATSPAIVVASGMGGIGKTQFVRKFIDKNRSKYVNIIWIDSENVENIISAFKDLLTDELDIKTENANGKEKKPKTIIEQVLRKLCQRKTLFVYDNVDSKKSIDFVLSMAPPLIEQPHILITSRFQKWPEGIKVILMKVWDMVESMAYISKTLKGSEYDSEIDKISLAEILQHFPLALRQATAFINLQRGRDGFAIPKYINQYTRNTSKMLDSETFRDCSICPYEKTTYTTWIITTDAIQADKLYGKLAIKIFKMIAYFTADAIERDFFHHLTEVEDVNQQADYKEDLKSAVDLLVTYSMVNSQAKQNIFSIHRLVQQVTQLQLKDSPEKESTLRDALKLMTNLIAKATSDKIRLNAISVFLFALSLPDLMKEFGFLAVTILQQLIMHRKNDQAKAFGDTIVGPLTDILGPNDRILLQIQYNNANVFFKNFLFNQTLQMSLTIYDKQKMNFGEDDFDTLKTQCQVADSYEALGDEKRAIQWYEEVLEKQKTCLVENHPDTLETMCKLAFLLKELGRDDEALRLYVEVFVKRKTLFGPTNLLTVERNVVHILKYMGDRQLELRTHTDFLTRLTGWEMSGKPMSLTTKGFFTVYGSTRSQFIHTDTLQSTYFNFLKN